MKVWLWVLGCIGLLCGCRQKSLSVEYELVLDQNVVYAYDLQDEKMVQIRCDYPIETYEDIFDLYTVYQNYLPIGYGSLAAPNLELLDSFSEQDHIYYEVNAFILLMDYEKFQDLLAATNKLYGYGVPHFFLNGTELA